MVSTMSHPPYQPQPPQHSYRHRSGSNSSSSSDEGSANKFINVSPQSAASRKAKRSTTTAFQLRHLRYIFQLTRFPTTELREQIGAVLGMTARSVQVWFQNQRQRSKVPPANAGPNGDGYDPIANAAGLEKAQLYIKQVNAQFSPPSSPQQLLLTPHQQPQQPYAAAPSHNPRYSQPQYSQPQYSQPQPLSYSQPQPYEHVLPGQSETILASGSTPLMRRFPMVTIKPFARSPRGISPTAAAATTLLAAAASSQHRSSLSPSSQRRRLPDPVPSSTAVSPLLSFTTPPPQQQQQKSALSSALPLQRIMDVMDQEELAAIGATGASGAGVGAGGGQCRLRPRSTSFHLPPVSSLISRLANSGSATPPSR